jgi:para-nitrobenzyl esterase
MNEIKNPTILTQSGYVSGLVEQGVNKWLGIRYATPPVGDLRFKRARPIGRWDGVFEAVKFGPKPVQFDHTYREGKDNGSEDCLTLNIWAPENAKELPVFVWLYGGAFAAGSSTDPVYDGTHFAREGVVFVSLNYRVGVFGFYDFSSFATGQGFDSNCGFSDQIEALIWIRENIRAFGGDVNNITVAGESAGGSSVLNLLAAPRAKGLFQKGIMQSALPHSALSREMAKKNLRLFLKAMELGEREIPWLQQAKVPDLVNAAAWLRNNSQYSYPGLYRPGPVIDDLLPEYPVDAIKKGIAKDIPLIIGTNKDEGSLFVKSKHTRFPNSWEMAGKMFMLNEQLQKLPGIRSYYQRFKGERRQMREFAKDYAFLRGATEVADVQRQYASTWMYRFDFETVIGKLTGKGASHTAEIPFALDNTDKGVARIFLTGTSRKKAGAVRKDMHGAWINFAKTGNPNSNGLLQWPRYERDSRPTFIFNTRNKIEFDPGKEAMEIWEGLKFYRE